MAAEAPSAGPTPEDVQHQMADTRAHLTRQVHALEDKVLGYAHEASDAVEGAMDSVKDAVRASAGSVRQAAEDATVGCAAFLGFACGRLTRR